MSDAPRFEPYDIACEQALLGALLIDNHKIDTAIADLEPVHFYEALHSRIFEMITVLYSEGVVTPLVLHSMLRDDPALKEIGGLQYVAGLAAACPALPDVRGFIRIIREMASRRALVTIAEGVVSAVYATGPESRIQVLADQATESLLQIGRLNAKPVLSVYDIAMESMAEYEAVKRGDPVPMVRTGFANIDDELGGLRGGDFIVLSGKSGMGKSALAGSLARNTAKAGVPTLVFSKEMTRRQWVERMVCDEDFDTAQMALWYQKVRNHRMSQPEAERFALAARAFEGLPMDIRDEDDLNIAQISAIARAFKAKHGGQLGIVYLDYIQIVEPMDYKDNRERQVAMIARGCKSLAKRLNWPVVALSQMNENDTARSKEEKRPQLSDLRESKVIGQEADVVLAPHRPAYYIENRKPEAAAGEESRKAWQEELDRSIHVFEALCLKNRHGRRQDFELWCEIGASAIRAEAPRRYMTAPDQAALDLYANNR